MAIRTNTQVRTLETQWLRHVANLGVEEAYLEMKSAPGGLDEARVEASREEFGSNEGGEPRRDGLLMRIVKAFADPFAGILFVLAIVSFVTDVIMASPGAEDPSATILILAMVFASGLLRFVQETRSGDAAAALAKTIQTTCLVEREGAGRRELPLSEVVVGDLVHLAAGDIIPADLRLVSARDLFVSQSALTGESEPVEKRANLSSAANDAERASIPVTDLEDIAFQGTTVVSGTGVGLVVAVGEHTMFGSVARGLSQSTSTQAGASDLRPISMLLVRLMLVMAPVVFVINAATKGDWLQALLFSLSVAVGLTPEMLPMIVTTCMAKGAVDLSRRQVIVKRLDAIADMGGMDVLCCDKTGTLTEDHVVLERHLGLDGEESARVLELAFLNSHFGTGLKNLIDSAIIERAAREGVADGGVSFADRLIDEYRLVDELPFDFDRRCVSVVVAPMHADGAQALMVTKGALEEVLEASDYVETAEGVLALDDAFANSAVALAKRLASHGMRVLGVGWREVDAASETASIDDEHGLVLAGLLAFLDPPKMSAATAIKAMTAHGVTTKVLTGDSGLVAACVCETIGLDAREVLSGTDVEAMDDAELARAVERVTVFAKLSPQQKVRVVEALRAGGHVVGFMGDGINDAAAMRASNCGISVDTAVDVARESADIVLLEKDLMVLERGIELGRATFANMEKYVRITAASNFGNVATVVAASILLPFLPMTAAQLLLLNLIYDVSCMAVPWDAVDEEELALPRRWNVGDVRRFMMCLGPVSTVIDLATFAVLFWLVCPAVAGGAWGVLDEAGRTLFAATFQAGWFIESMVTQVLAIHLVRTRKRPLVESRASWQLTLAGAFAVVAAIAVPFSPVGVALDMAALPPVFFGWLLVLVLAYAGLVLLAYRPMIRSRNT